MIVDDKVYLYNVQRLEGGGEARGIIGNYAKLIITGETVTTIDTPLPLTVMYKDFQNNDLLSENRPIQISVNGEQKIELVPANGQAEFDFVSAVPGTFKIQAGAEFPCDSAEIEVVVS